MDMMNGTMTGCGYMTGCIVGSIFAPIFALALLTIFIIQVVV